jgi:uncharacterized SAM-binding protein YcdF (DUF218 family)
MIKTIKRTCFIVITLILIWGAGFLWFANVVPKTLEPDNQSTDAIVVLTGGSQRIATGLDLLENGQAKQMFISGVDPISGYGSLAQKNKNWPSDAKDKIVLGYDAKDTYGNGLETAEWMHKQKYQSLRLVTSAYHMQRSLLIFHNIMPNIQIIPHPVFQKTIHAKKWWLWKGTTRLIFSEYNKFLLAHLVLISKKLRVT